MFPSLTSPVIFAHRGASSHAPENTLAAFQLAVDHGARALELDVQLTKDKEVVVFHDTHLGRTTNGSGRIKDLTLAEVKRLNAGISFSPGYQNQKVPTLAEVFDLIGRDILINIELKNLGAPLNDLPGRTASVIRACNAADRVLISSFNSVALARFHREMPGIPRGFLLETALMANLYSNLPRLTARMQSIHLPYPSLNPFLIAAFKKAGKLVFSYTLNHTKDILSAVKMGIDGFFTDDPGFATRILEQNGLLPS